MSPPRPHIFHRSRFAHVADRVIEASWDRGWHEKSPLEPEHIWQSATEGFDPQDELSIRSPADVSDFRDRLVQLCHALNTDAELTPLGHAMAFGQVQNAVRWRFELGRLWRDRPELAETPIAPPIIVVGQMRSGTTRVQRLLAADPAHSGTRFCDSVNPVPRTPDTRPLRARLTLFLARRVNPWLDTMHPFGATRTDEEIGWLSAALSPTAFEAQWRIPSFVALNVARDNLSVYREFARILRTDAAHRGNADRPRVLKCPQYTEDLSAMLEVFPDARGVRSRRDTRAVLASSLSMVASQMAFQNKHLNTDMVEDYWRRRIAHREERMQGDIAACDRPVAELSFDALNEDWRAEMREAYAALDLPLTKQAISAMEREAAKAQRDPHHRHRSQIEQLASI